MEEKTIYIKYSDDRKKEYAIQTAIVIAKNGKMVKKKAIFPEGKSHIKRMVENFHILTGIYGKEHVAQCLKYSDTEMYMEYIEGERLSEVLEMFLERNEHDKFESMLGKYIVFLKDSCSEDKMEYHLEEKDLSSIERVSNIDMIFDNIILRNDEFVIIDYEWLLPKIDYRIVLSRALSIFSIRASNCRGIEKANLQDRNDVFDWVACKEISESIVNVVIESALNKYKKMITIPAIVDPVEVQALKDKIKETSFACEKKEKIIQEKDEVLEDLEKNIRRQSEELKAIKETRGYKVLENIRALRKKYINNTK